MREYLFRDIEKALEGVDPEKVKAVVKLVKNYLEDVDLEWL